MWKWDVHEYQSSQEIQKDCYDKEISDKKQQDLCLHNEEDISSLQDGTNYYTLPFLFLCPISNIEKIFMHILVFRPFQSSSLMITSQTTCMVRRRGRYSYNTHGSILKCSWRGRRMGGQSSTGTSLKLQRRSTSMKAQYPPSASAVSQMRFICLFTMYDATFQRFLCCIWNFVLLCNGVTECRSYLMWFDYEILVAFIRIWNIWSVL